MRTSPKITLIGAGSIVFTRNLCSDILLTPALQDSTISLMDINPVGLERSRKLVQALIDRRGLKATVEATLDQREAVTDARYVITTFQQGGLDAYALDISIPQKYGVEQCVGDTLGPGGVFRGLRTIPGHEATGIALTEPLLVPVWVYLAWGDAPDWWTLVGGGLILVGLAIRYLVPQSQPAPD